MQAWAGFGHDAFPADWTPVDDGGGPVRMLDPEGDRMDGDFSRRHQCDFWATTIFGPVAPRD